MSRNDSLVSNFKNMSDREILIATCLKVEGIEARMDNHSVENDNREKACLKRYSDLSEDNDGIRRLIETRERAGIEASLKARDYVIIILVSALGSAVTGMGFRSIAGLLLK